VPGCDLASLIDGLQADKAAGRLERGEIDLVWLSGDRFSTLKRKNLLYGPYARGLPNFRLVDKSRPSVIRHFDERVDGMASPWGILQLVLLYDTQRTSRPPATMDDLLEWVRQHPGRFTYPAPPDSTGAAFVRQIFYHAARKADAWHGSFDSSRLAQVYRDCYRLLREIAPFLWQQGDSYPESSAHLDRLFAQGSVDFSLCRFPAAAPGNIAAGLYPKTVRTLVFQEGTIATDHFVAIPFNAAHRAGAMVVANFLLSPEAQLKKADPLVWGDLPAIDVSRLYHSWRERFRGLARGSATLSGSELADRRLPELPADISNRLEAGWQTQVRYRQ